jgi:hypothetical protein
MITTRPERGAADAGSRRRTQSQAIVPVAAQRELVRRIVHSSTFGRSERLGTMLTYVCEMVLKGREAELNEQKIGQAVFKRAQDYDSSVDGIVRSQASRLRQRLELYFQQEGADEPVRIVIPRGGYVPVFEAQSTSAPTRPTGEPTEAIPEIAPASSTQITNVSPRDSFIRRWWQQGLSLILCLMLAVLWIHDRRTLVPAAVASPTHPFWSHLFTKGQATMVVAPDSGLVLFRNMSGQNIDLKAYIDGGYRAELNGSPQSGPAASRSDWLLNLANRRYTSIVDLDAILSLKDRARTLGSEVTVRYARDLRPDDFKASDAILLGSSAANPWVELFEHNMNFVLKDGPTETFSVLSRNPQKGEPALWEFGKNDPEQRVVGLIAYMPSLAGDGNTLVLQGATMSGTEAAMDFITDDTKLLPFLNRIRHPDGTLPHFEVLLGTRNMGSSAVRSEILAWRTMN